jgi:FkbM family methyltransferase
MVVRRVRQVLVRELHRRGIYRIGTEPFGAIDKDRLFRRYGIDLVFDVGANVGEYASHLRYLGYRGLIVSMEPERRSFSVLASRAEADPLWEVHQLAAGERDMEAQFNIASQTVSSSFLVTTERFHIEHPGVVVTSREPVQVRRLDGFVSRVPEGARTWIKLDVEGYERQAIAGGTQLIALADALEVELATERLYEGEPLFFEVVPAIYELGFQLVAVAPAFVAPSGKTLKFDGLFVRA